MASGEIILCPLCDEETERLVEYNGERMCPECRLEEQAEEDIEREERYESWFYDDDVEWD